MRGGGRGMEIRDSVPFRDVSDGAGFGAARENALSLIAGVSPNMRALHADL